MKIYISKYVSMEVPKHWTIAQLEKYLKETFPGKCLRLKND